MSSATEGKIDLRLIASVLLLAVAAFCTWRTIEGLAARRVLRTELAEVSHARYDLLNIDRWVGKLLPILDAQIDALDLKAAGKDLKPTVVKALYNLLDAVKEKMSTPTPQNKGASGGFMGGANAMMATMMIGALKPHVPEYADVVMAELGKPENTDALKKYMKGVVAGGARNTFGNVDTKYYDYILKEHGCADVTACQQQLKARVQAEDDELRIQYLSALTAAAVAFALLMLGRSVLARPSVVVLLLFCVWCCWRGGIFTAHARSGGARNSRISASTFLEHAEFRLLAISRALLPEQKRAGSFSHSGDHGPAGYVDCRRAGADVQRSIPGRPRFSLMSLCMLQAHRCYRRIVWRSSSPSNLPSGRWRT